MSGVKGKKCVVTGASGFVGTRLVEMLCDRGAASVVAFDIIPPKYEFQDSRVKVVLGDVRDTVVIDQICEGADCVWHNAAAVGPFHPIKLYTEVNYEGTLNVIASCKKFGVRKIVMSSSPSTRLTGADVDGVTEAELPSLPMKWYVQEYAKTKAMGEKAMTDACDGKTLLTVAVAPHQVYGPRDNLFLPNVLEAAGTGRMRVLGNGKNRICFTHVDNYCHGLILGEAALYEGSPALGGFYIVTDMDTHTQSEGYAELYPELDRAITGMGWPSIYTRFHVPYWILWAIGWLGHFFSKVTGVSVKITPFTVTMMTMHRWFKCDAAARDLGYAPIKSFREEWPVTIQWFKDYWLPGFQLQDTGIGGLHASTQRSIDMQSVDAKKRQ